MKYRGKYEILIRISGYILIVTMFCPLYLIVPLIEHFSIFLFLLWIIPTIFWSCYVINEREINEMLNDR